MTNPQRTISACIIGKPNAGKSSFLNQIIDHKISIVTPKVQTTRSIITGIITSGDTQIIMYDTPGIFEAKKHLERAMVRCAWSSLNGADIVLLIIDNTKSLDDNLLQILERLRSLRIIPVFILNKIDLVSKQHEENIEYLKKNFEGSIIFRTSALRGEGIQDILTYIMSNATVSPWLYAEDDITNLSMRFLASEITREQLFMNLHEELPYNLTVQTEQWQENKNKSVKINQVIVVSRDNYKAMILGNKGSMIKEIGSKARIEMENSFGMKIHLFLFVKVREMWDSNPEYYNYMGLKFSKN